MTTSEPSRRRLPTVQGKAPFSRRARLPLERCGPDDLFHDYVLDSYPPRAPLADKLRSVNVLYEAFAIAGVEEEGAALVARVRRGLGPFRTVWGIKHDRVAGITGFELYFYDFERKHPDLSIEAVRRIVAPSVELDARERRAIPWHMFSVEITPAELRARAPVAAHVYVDMRSYVLRGDELELENVYTFHDPRKEIDHVLHRLKGSLHNDLSSTALRALVPPALFRCHRMCVANKRNADAVYFSRVPTEAMLEFVRAREWPSDLVSMIEAYGPAFEHLFWCVGMNFTQPDDVPVITKSGIYGSF